MSVKPLYAAIALALSFSVMAQDEHGHDEKEDTHKEKGKHEQGEQTQRLESKRCQ